VLQDEIHGVCLAVEQAEQTHPKHDALVAVPGCTARSAVARTRRHVARRAPGGSILRRAPGVRWRCLSELHQRGRILERGDGLLVVSQFGARARQLLLQLDVFGAPRSNLLCCIALVCDSPLSFKLI
jgi:hypothetical protein